MNTKKEEMSRPERPESESSEERCAGPKEDGCGRLFETLCAKCGVMDAVLPAEKVGQTLEACVAIVVPAKYNPAILNYVVSMKRYLKDFFKVITVSTTKQRRVLCSEGKFGMLSDFSFKSEIPIELDVQGVICFKGVSESILDAWLERSCFSPPVIISVKLDLNQASKNSVQFMTPGSESTSSRRLNLPKKSSTIKRMTSKRPKNVRKICRLEGLACKSNTTCSDLSLETLWHLCEFLSEEVENQSWSPNWSIAATLKEKLSESCLKGFCPPQNEDAELSAWSQLSFRFSTLFRSSARVLVFLYDGVDDVALASMLEYWTQIKHVQMIPIVSNKLADVLSNKKRSRTASSASSSSRGSRTHTGGLSSQFVVTKDGNKIFARSIDSIVQYSVVLRGIRCVVIPDGTIDDANSYSFGANLAMILDEISAFSSKGASLVDQRGYLTGKAVPNFRKLQSEAIETEFGATTAKYVTWFVTKRNIMTRKQN